MRKHKLLRIDASPIPNPNNKYSFRSMSQQTSLIFFHERKVHLVSMKQLRVTWILSILLLTILPYGGLVQCIHYSATTHELHRPHSLLFLSAYIEEKKKPKCYSFILLGERLASLLGNMSWNCYICCNVRAVFPFFNKWKLNFQSVRIDFVKSMSGRCVSIPWKLKIHGLG